MTSTDEVPAVSTPLRGHVPALDGVRGLAIILVMLAHFTVFPQMTGDTTVNRIFRSCAATGWVGVDLFFVLSGFLITGILIDSRGGPGFFFAFYARRFLRIFPLYYAFLATGLFLVPVLVPGVTRVPASTQIWYWTYLANIRFALTNHVESPVWLSHFWSLAVEEQFYLVWPFIVFAATRRTLVRICVLVPVLALVLRIPCALAGRDLAAHVLMPCRMDELAVGGLVAALVRGGADWRAPSLDAVATWARRAIAVGVLSLLILGAFRHGLHAAANPFVAVFSDFGLAVLFGGLVALPVVAPSGWAHRAFRSPILRFFGRYAYGLYVFQQPVALFLSPPRLAIETLPRVAGSHLPAAAVVQLVGFAITTALAVASYHLLETRFLELKRLFPYGRRVEVLPENANRAEG